MRAGIASRDRQLHRDARVRAEPGIRSTFYLRRRRDKPRDRRSARRSGFDVRQHQPPAVTAGGSIEFRSVHQLLRAGGVFVFDVNTDAAYRSEWTKSSAVVEPDAALFVRGGYDEPAQFVRTLITMFRLLDGWQRVDVEVVQRCYDERELAEWLLDAGFAAPRSTARPQSA